MEKTPQNITTIPDLVTLMIGQFALLRNEMIAGFEKMATKEGMNFRFEKMEEYVEGEFRGVDGRFDEMNLRFGKVDKRFDALEKKVDDKNDVLNRRTNWAVNTIHSIVDIVQEKLDVKVL